MSNSHELRMALERDLNLTGYQKTLATIPDEAVVGITCNICDCPLARYLTNKGYLEVRVDSVYVQVRNPQAENAEELFIRYEPYAELQDFMARIDDTAVKEAVFYPVTAKTAKAVLQQVLSPWGDQL